MKKSKYLFILPLIFFAFIFSTCKKQHDPPLDDFYFSCKINGQTYIPAGCTNCVTCTILADTTFLLGGNAGFEALDIGIIKLDQIPISATTYILSNNPQQNATWDTSPSVPDIYATDSIRTGKLQILTLDKTNRIISGTFNFKAYNAYRNDSVLVTDGKFRWKLAFN